MSFEILKNISYLDNANTTHKPKVVVDAITNFYLNEYSNTHRGVYSLSENATIKYEESKVKVSKLINCDPREIVFVRGATEGLNHLAKSFSNKTVLLTEIEHHSNFLPWYKFAKSVSLVKYNKDIGCLDHIPFGYNGEDVVSFSLMSNVSGEVLDAKKIIEELRRIRKDVVVILDACQAVSHMRIDVKDLDCDFLVFSGHKMYGPTGTGVLYGKFDLLDSLDPFFYGGNMVLDANPEGFVWQDAPQKHEAGTMDGAGFIGLGVACDFLLEDFDKKMVVEFELKEYLVNELRNLGVGIVGHTHNSFGPVVSFVCDIHPHDLASVCDKEGVCIRAGHHCAQPFMNSLGVVATSRASLSFYNTKSDIDKLVFCIKKAREMFNG